MADDHSEKVIDALRDNLRGRVVGPRDADWDTQRRAWHLLADQRPAAVVHVTDADDIAAAIRIAAVHGLPVMAQPVGHGATPAADGTILLRTGALDGIEIDSERRVARVEAGVRWRDLNAALAETGLMSLPGSSGDTSVVGYTLGGGLSWFGRKHGYAAHHVLAAELVTADGDLVRVTRESDPDLFWALRGGGGDFGIVVALDLNLLPADGMYGGRLMWPIEHARDVLRVFADVTSTAPDDLSLWAWLLNLPDLPFVPEVARGHWLVAVDVVFLGSADDAEEFVRPLRAVAAPWADSLAAMPAHAVGTISQEPDDPLPGMLRSVLLEEFGAAAQDALLDVAAPGSASPMGAYEVRHLGGALARRHGQDGSAGHVDEPYLLLFGGLAPTPELAEVVTKSIEATLAAMSPWTSDRALPNFSSGEESRRFHSAETLTRLRRIKNRIDPRGTIRGNHPVARAEPFGA
ncbi:FAD-binding oxidoreductase [Jiangella anatolica]|uniref:FAD-linked oxidase n=1 Tax=Jiangella anatolica TaxID=2670374 RepID=A0A2W2B7D0_9ACTN|nr:FAD-binding oxidoreductase [Jiangella anatolica]PZF83371.1 FAD-linked oxidase [Jiangella anatolica]